MKRYIHLLVTYVLIALAVVLLYAPWGLALRPWDYEIWRAGLSIIAAIGLVGVFGASTYLALREPDVKLLEAAKIMDDDEVVPVLEEYTDTPYVGGLAEDALEQVRSASRKRGRLHKIIATQFAPGSLSWEKFTNLVDNAQRTVLRNSALVANSIQSFDREGYAKAHRRSQSDAKTEELALYDDALAGMRQVIEANDQVLLEMGKLELELSRLETADAFEDNDETVEELRQLIENTKYYR